MPVCECILLCLCMPVCVHVPSYLYTCVCVCVSGHLALTLAINSLQLISGCNIIHQPLIETTRRGSNSK